METQDFNRDLMDYLYGEMTYAQKKEFEAQMATDENLRLEYEALKGVRKELSRLEGTGIMEPTGIWRNGQPGWIDNRTSRSHSFLWSFMAVAASIVMLLIAGYLTSFSLTVNNQGLQIGFQKEEAPALSIEDVKNILAQEIEKNNAGIMTNIHDTQEGIDLRLSNLEKTVENPVYAHNELISKKELDSFFTGVEQQNAALLQQYLNQTSAQQQEYFKTMLTQFNDYLQQQRVEDMNMLQAGLMEIKNSQTQQKIETDMALANLFTTVRNR